MVASSGARYHLAMNEKSSAMTAVELAEALDALGWRQADLCRKVGLHKDTPMRWLKGKTEIPNWVRAYLAAMLEIQRLHRTYVQV
jgi:transcriptional regulator with XRE-family HTH domain